MWTLLAASLAALTLTGELPVTDATEPAPAPGRQSSPSLASDGNSFVAMWQDARPPYPHGASRVHFRRLDADGKPLGQHSTPGPESVTGGAIASNGDGYLAAWDEAGGVVALSLLTDDLELAGEPRRVAGVARAQVRNLIAGRLRYLLIVKYESTDSAYLVDADGDVLRQIDIPGAVSQLSAMALPGGGFRIASIRSICDGVNPCTRSMQLTTVSETGNATTATIFSGLGNPVHLVAAAGGDRLLVAISAGGPPQTIDFLILNVGGNVVVPSQHLMATGNHPFGARPLSAKWDGQQFLLGWTTHDGDTPVSRFEAIRIEPSGRIFDETPIPVGGVDAAGLASASNGHRVVLLTAEVEPNRDVFARAMPSFTELAAAPATLLSAGAPHQEQAQLAAIGDEVIAVYRKRDIPATIGATFFRLGSDASRRVVEVAGPGNRDQHSPAVAASADGYLVAWTEANVGRMQGDGHRVLARRVSRSGTLLDEHPLVLADYYGSVARSRNVAVGSDGRDFLVVLVDADGVLVGERVRADGRAADLEPFALHTKRSYSAVAPRVLWNGSAYVVLWGHDARFPGVASISATYVLSVRVTPDGAVDPIPQVIWNDPGWSFDLAVARGDDELLAVWHSTPLPGQCLQAMPLDLDGRPKLDRPRDLGCRELTDWFEPRAAVTWDGNRFLVTATVVDGTPGLRGYIVDRDTNVLAVSDAVTGEPSAWDPAAVTTSNGAALLYSRISPEDGYVGRLLMRLAPTPQLRLRGVRR